MKYYKIKDVHSGDIACVCYNGNNIEILGQADFEMLGEVSEYEAMKTVEQIAILKEIEKCHCLLGRIFDYVSVNDDIFVASEAVDLISASTTVRDIKYAIDKVLTVADMETP